MATISPFPIMRIGYTLVLIFLGLLFATAYEQSPLEYWGHCYVISIVVGLGFLFHFRTSYFTISYVFVVLQIIGLTLAIAPFLFFGVIELDIRNSIFINSLALLIFVALALIILPKKAPSLETKLLILSSSWKEFFKINTQMFFISLPFVLLAIVISGGYRAYGGLEDSGFDRIASLKGLGPLMIFSFLNTFCGGLMAIKMFFQGKRFLAMLFVVSFLLINGFTYGRGNMISVFFFFYVFLGLRSKMSFKLILSFLVIGIIVVMLKLLRSSFEGESDLALWFLMQFWGDFDSVVNTQHLLEFINDFGYPGFYHIWSSLFNYIPRALFPDKPQYFGILYLNDLVFPGLYLGAEGGTNLNFGFAGTLYSAAGMITLILGIFLIAVSLGYFERLLIVWSSLAQPDMKIIVYLIAISNVVILYREGLYAILNLAFYALCYFIVYYILLKLYRMLKSIDQRQVA